MLFFLFSQTCEKSSSQQGNPILSLLPLILIFAVFYFLLIMPQQKKQKQQRKMLTELNKGDRVITSSGIYGTIANVKEHSFIILIADGVKVEIEKGYVVGKINAVRESTTGGKDNP